MQKVLLIFFLTLALNLSFAQQRFIVSGTVSDQESGETLIGVSVNVVKLELGTTTNEYGFYSISLPAEDSLIMEYSYVGFRMQGQKVCLEGDTIVNVELGAGVQLEEVIVKANSYEQQLFSTEMSVEAITTREARLVPLLLGESDIIKTIQLKPGIPSGAEGTTGLFVRGGGSDQNLIILDEAIVYNANHLFGFFSTFNTDAVKDLKIYKGGFPAQYGGRLSSVIDIKLKEGNNKKFSGSGGIGLIASRLTLEGPVQKNKSSFIVSGRRTYIDVFTRAVNRANTEREDFNPIPDYFFYDLNTKINYQLGDKDRIYLSGYFGRDVFGFQGDFFDFDFDWGNVTGTLRWNHVFNPRLFANTTFTYSDYQYNIENKLTGFSFKVGSNIRDANLKSDFYLALNNRHTFRFGAGITRHNFTVGRLKAGSDDGVVSFSAGRVFHGAEFGMYAADDFEFGERLKINLGLRISGFNNEKEWYAGFEPRLSARYILSDRFALKSSYARMHQYLHLVASAGIALPTDIWYPSTGRIRPQRSDQLAVGTSYLLGKHFFLTAEAYYKWLNNQIEFVDGAELFANNDLEGEFAVGRGRGYGFELSIEKEEGRITGWIGYTLAFVERGEFEPVDPEEGFLQKEYFSPIYDRRHDLSVVAMLEISRRLLFNATFVYGSGDLRWLAPGRFALQDIPGAGFEAVIPDYLERNNYRLPSYHRLDLGLIYKFFPKWGENDLTLNVVNAYDRRNTFFIYLEPEFEQVTNGGVTFDVPERIVARQVSLFPILPSLTWNFKF